MAGLSKQPHPVSSREGDPGRAVGGGIVSVAWRSRISIDLPRWVALSLAGKAGMHEIVLVGSAGQVVLPLGSFEHDDVVAIWRSVARASGLPLAVVGLDGCLAFPFSATGSLRSGRGPDRRYLRVLAGRRPRFLVKRRTGHPLARPPVYREPELAAGPAR